MDISFHYFAVKVLAVKAGFSVTEAQTIATFSQFTDDYNAFNWLNLENVPSYAHNLMVGPLFNPATTGFNFTDNGWFTDSKYRRRILIPFHFITERHLNEGELPQRVKPYTENGEDNALLREMLKEAKEKYQTCKRIVPPHIETKTYENNYNMALMRIGVLLHILADTYAHQSFSGGWGWENESKLEQVLDKGGLDRTSEYWSQTHHLLPSIGHANAATAPDETNISFSVKQKENAQDTNYTRKYRRNNTDTFINAAEVIFNYLRSVLTDLNQATSFNSIRAGLKEGFEIGYKPTPTKADKVLDKRSLYERLCEHWSKISAFNGIKFEYNKNNVLGCNLTDDESAENIQISFWPETRTDDFYRYNTVAHQIRTKVTGPLALTPNENQLHAELLAKISQANG